MGNAGTALMGVGHGRGPNRAVDAAVAAISSPLLDFPLKKAKGIVFNVVGGEDLTLDEINSAADIIYENTDLDANIIFGAAIDEKLGDEVTITVLATGFGDNPKGLLEEDDMNTVFKTHSGSGSGREFSPSDLYNKKGSIDSSNNNNNNNKNNEAGGATAGKKNEFSNMSSIRKFGSGSGGKVPKKVVDGGLLKSFFHRIVGN